MTEAYLYDGIRSAFGRYGGRLSSLRPDDLSAQLMDKLVPSGLKADIDEVVLGCSNQAGEDSRNVARNSLLASSLPETIPALTVNRLCASGLAAVAYGARTIQCMENEIVVAGGVESMSRAPIVMSKAETAFGRDHQFFDTTLGARFSNPKVLEKYGSHSMPETGDEVAREIGISRDEADAFALRSQERYAAALSDGFYDSEIASVELPQKGRRPHPDPIVNLDEHPRPNSSLEKLAKLNPLFAGGVVTAGNASGLNDGGACLLLGNRDAESKISKRPMARFLGSTSVGIRPSVMGLGPVEAIKKLLGMHSLSLKDMDVIEINEAFASQVLGCLKLLELDFADSRVNPNGGAISIGHPLGASGARLALTAARQLERTNGRYAVVSLCVGMGQGTAALFERCS